MDEIAPGIHRWTSRHPEWHPGAFGAEVASYALACWGGTLLIDPLLPEGTGPELLAGVVARRVEIVITIPYHVRSAATLAEALGATVHGHPGCLNRLPADVPFRAVRPDGKLPLGARAHPIGSPRRQEQPVSVPEHRALLFGDAVVQWKGGLHVWTDGGERWYRTRLVPSLEPLLDLDCERILVTHGRPVLRRGRAALRTALAAGPWSRP